MRRIVITGIGIVSAIGDTAADVTESLRHARSGVVAAPEYAELGFRCQVHAPTRCDWESLVDRRAARFLAPGTGYAHVAMEQAIADSGLTPEDDLWQENALCAQTDPEAFFPEKGGSTREAKRICQGCEVRDACLEYALSNDERFGIWGGLSERERRRLKRGVI